MLAYPANDGKWYLPKHCIQSGTLLCTATDATPDKRFLAFLRRSSSETSLSSWMTYSSYLRCFVQNSNKNKPLVDKVEIINVNSNYTNVCHLNGCKVTISLQDLAPCLSKENQQDNFDAVDTEITVNSESPNHTPDDVCSNKTREEFVPALPQPNLLQR